MLEHKFEFSSISLLELTDPDVVKNFQITM